MTFAHPCNCNYILRSILTDPEIHQKLHDSHNELHSRYYGYWYGQDLFAYDSQVTVRSETYVVGFEEYFG